MKSRLRKLLRRKLSRQEPAYETANPSREWVCPDAELVNDLPKLVNRELIESITNKQLNALAQPIGPDLWLVPFFEPDTCERITAVIDHRLAWQRLHPQNSPNSMHYAGVVFDPMGFDSPMSEIRDRIMNPLRREFYPEFGHLDDDYAFAATYGHQLDRRLGFHVDDSELTLNVALSEGYTGGEVVFQGRRCSLHRQEQHRPEEEVVVTIPRGHGLLHAGSHRHLVTTVAGERRNLIMWCRSSETRGQTDESCPEWCGHISEADNPG